MSAIAGRRAALLSCAVALAVLVAPPVAGAVDTLTPEQAEQVVKAVELLPADFPGAVPYDWSLPDFSSLLCAEQKPLSCPLATGRTATFVIHDGYGGAGAMVFAMPTATAARRGVAALATARGRRRGAALMRAAFVKHARKEKLRVRVTVRPLWVGGPDGAGMRIRIGSPPGPGRAIQTIDERWFAEGPVEVVLLSAVIGVTVRPGIPPSGAAAHRVTDALRARVDAALTAATA